MADSVFLDIENSRGAPPKLVHIESCGIGMRRSKRFFAVTPF
ncbi:MAG TPA: hypothetical protein VKV17_02355 [Bryobacteraceae bacterium]|nr:hypothetical protein [Bryobacteraceae bacterium]